MLKKVVATLKPGVDCDLHVLMLIAVETEQGIRYDTKQRVLIADRRDSLNPSGSESKLKDFLEKIEALKCFDIITKND